MRSVIILMVGILLSMSAICQSDCDKLKSSKDEFTGNRSLTSPPIHKMRLLPMFAVKEIKGSDTLQYIYLTIFGEQLPDTRKGVIILFYDGTKLDLPEQAVEVGVTGSSYVYSATLPLDEDLYNKLATTTIKGYRLSSFSQMIDEKTSKIFQGFVSCIKTRNP